MEIKVEYKANNDESAMQCLHHLITDIMNSDKSITVKISTTNPNKRFLQLRKCIYGITPEINEENHIMTFFNGSTIQIYYILPRYDDPNPITKKPLCDGGDSRDWSINNRTNEQLDNEWK